MCFKLSFYNLSIWIESLSIHWASLIHGNASHIPDVYNSSFSSRRLVGRDKPPVHEVWQIKTHVHIQRTQVSLIRIQHDQSFHAGPYDHTTIWLFRSRDDLFRKRTKHGQHIVVTCLYINSLYRPNKVTRLCYTIDGKLYFCINLPNTRHQRSVEGKVIDVYFLKRLRGSNYERCCFSTVQYTASYSDKSRPWQEWWQFGCQTDQRALSLALHITLLYTCVISDRDNVTDQY